MKSPAGEEQALMDGYRERLIIAVVAIVATESLDRMMEKRPGPSEHRRRIGETVHWARESEAAKVTQWGKTAMANATSRRASFAH